MAAPIQGSFIPSKSGSETFLWCMSFIIWSFLLVVWSFSPLLTLSLAVNRSLNLVFFPRVKTNTKVKMSCAFCSHSIFAFAFASVNEPPRLWWYQSDLLYRWLLVFTVNDLRFLDIIKTTTTLRLHSYEHINTSIQTIFTILTDVLFLLLLWIQTFHFKKLLNS